MLVSQSEVTFHLPAEELFRRRSDGCTVQSPLRRRYSQTMLIHGFRSIADPHQPIPCVVLSRQQLWIRNPRHIARRIIRRNRPCRSYGIRDARDFIRLVRDPNLPIVRFKFGQSSITASSKQTKTQCNSDFRAIRRSYHHLLHLPNLRAGPTFACRMPKFSFLHSCCRTVRHTQFAGHTHPTIACVLTALCVCGRATNRFPLEVSRLPIKGLAQFEVFQLILLDPA